MITFKVQTTVHLRPDMRNKVHLHAVSLENCDKIQDCLKISSQRNERFLKRCKRHESTFLSNIKINQIKSSRICNTTTFDCDAWIITFRSKEEDVQNGFYVIGFKDSVPLPVWWSNIDMLGKGTIPISNVKFTKNSMSRAIRDNDYSSTYLQ